MTEKNVLFFIKSLLIFKHSKVVNKKVTNSLKIILKRNIRRK